MAGSSTQVVGNRQFGEEKVYDGGILLDTRDQTRYNFPMMKNPVRG